MAGTQPRGGSPPRRRGRSKGQALVEFALIAPIFFLMFFGIVEFAFILTTLSGHNFAAREGARFGSIIGRTETDVQADQDILSAVIARSKALPLSTTLSVDIYKSLPNGDCVGGAVGTGACTEDKYTFTSKTSYALSGSMLWPANSRDDTLIGADYLGVRVLLRYTFITGFVSGLGTQLNLSATSVQRIEPQDYGADVPHSAPVASIHLSWERVLGTALGQPLVWQPWVWWREGAAT